MKSFVYAALCALLVSGSVLAAPCGSDVDGRGKVVRCACGDILVSSHTLTTADPVTQQPCPDTALLVNIPATAPDATLGFGSQVLSGSMRGHGLRILSGGPGGLTLVGPGAIGGFATGVSATRSTLKSAQDILAVGNGADGFSVGGSGFALRGCEARGNGRDGFVVGGRDFRLENTRALQNGGHGYLVNGRGATIGGDLGNEAMGNGRDGFVIRGRNVALDQPIATANARRGVRARVRRGVIAAPQVSANLGAAEPDRAPICSSEGNCR